MFVDILLHDLACDFGVEFESLRHCKIFEIRVHRRKTMGSHLKRPSEMEDAPKK